MTDPIATRDLARDAVPGFDTRVERLWKHRMAGPEFELRATFNAWEPEHVGARLVTAEIAAGLRPESDYLTRFEPETWKAIPA